MVNRFSLTNKSHSLLFVIQSSTTQRKLRGFASRVRGATTGVLKVLAPPDLIDQDDCWLVLLLTKIVSLPDEGDRDEM